MRPRMLPLIIAVGLISSVLMGTGIAAEEDEGGGGNNLATPVIFAEGYGLGGVMVDAADYTTTGFPGLTKAECLGEENWSGTDGAPYAVTFDESGADPTMYTLNIDGTTYLDPLAGTSVAPEGDYFLQPYTLDGDGFGMTTCWEADWIDGSVIDGVEINALDVGDSLVRVLREEGPNPIRVEFTPYQAAETAGTFQDGTLLDGYPMTQLWPPGFADGKPPSVGSGERQEVWATASSSSAGPVPAELASVYSHNARLMIHKLTWDGLPDSFADGNLDGYPSGVIPDTFDNNYDRWIEAVEFDGNVGGGEGEGFSSEVNQGGRALYGYNWGLGSVIDAGWYRITLSIDDDVDGVAANTLITGVNPGDQLADTSEGGTDAGKKGFFPPYLVEDADGNYVYVDVYIVPDSDTGKGKMKGRVTTESDSALGGKLVTIYDTSGAPAMTATTATDGTFEVSGLPGTYYVEVDDPVGKYRGEFYDDKATFEDADAVVITDGGTTIVGIELAEKATEPPVDPPVDPPVEPPVDPGGHFIDVGEDHMFHAAIEWLWQAGITVGCNPPDNDRFCPDAAVTRAQMATMFVRALGLTEGADVDRFVDDDGSVHEANINRLAAAGITVGCNPSTGNDRFCPNAPVTRAQMATMFVRALSLTEGADVDRFVDDDGSVHEANINRIAAAGITVGCNPSTGNDRFCPDTPITRAQMAAFYKRALT